MQKLVFFRNKSLIGYGELFFSLSIFFLPSTLFIGILFLIPASIIGGFLQNKHFIKDKWNLPFLTFGAWIILSSLLQNFVLKNNYESIWNPINSIIGLGNWLPFIWLFWSLQPFLNSKTKRRSFSLILIASTFPVLITGFGQYFFNWHGPLETLNGLIIWYQRPIESPAGLSGLFNNQNYAGSWLNFAWPFCLALCLEASNDLFRKTIALSFLSATGLAAFLTYSRNAWLGLITSFPIVVGKKGFKFFLPFFLIIIIFIFILSPISNSNIQENLKLFLPEKILLEFSEEGYIGLDSTRLQIFFSAINLIKENPIFGIGAASFPAIFLFETTFWKGHSHNLALELAVSYGLPATALFIGTIMCILFLSYFKIFNNKKNENVSFFDRAFWSALFFFMISQMVDIQYFDGKLSIIMWILVAGLKNIIEENQKKMQLIKNDDY